MLRMCSDERWRRNAAVELEDLVALWEAYEQRRATFKLFTNIFFNIVTLTVKIRR